MFVDFTAVLQTDIFSLSVQFQPVIFPLGTFRIKLHDGWKILDIWPERGRSIFSVDMRLKSRFITDVSGSAKADYDENI